MIKKFRLTILAVGILALTAPSAVHAQQVPGPHPAYLHALSDLRAARHYLNDGWAWAPVKHDDNAAIREIDAAIGEIKRAAIDDGKGMNDPFPIDTSLSPHDRFRKANELLWKAHSDLSRAEDVPESRGLRDRAIGHVDRAASDRRQRATNRSLAVALTVCDQMRMAGNAILVAHFGCETGRQIPKLLICEPKSMHGGVPSSL